MGKPTLSESIAELETQLSVAEAQGNKRKANAIRLMLRRFEKMKKPERVKPVRSSQDK